MSQGCVNKPIKGGSKVEKKLDPWVLFQPRLMSMLMLPLYLPELLITAPCPMKVRLAKNGKIDEKEPTLCYFNYLARALR
jgi:hypothetical protein